MSDKLDARRSFTSSMSSKAAAARMTEDTIAALCTIISRALDMQYQSDTGRDSDSPAWKEKLARLFAISDFVLRQLVPALPLYDESLWRRSHSDHHGSGPYHIIYELATLEGAGFQLRKFESDKGMGYTFSPAPLMNHAEVYYNPEGWFFYTRDQRTGLTFKAPDSVPLYDFGLPAPQAEAKNGATNDV